MHPPPRHRAGRHHPPSPVLPAGSVGGGVEPLPTVLRICCGGVEFYCTTTTQILFHARRGSTRHAQPERCCAALPQSAARANSIAARTNQRAEHRVAAATHSADSQDLENLCWFAIVHRHASRQPLARQLRVIGEANELNSSNTRTNRTFRATGSEATWRCDGERQCVTDTARCSHDEEARGTSAVQLREVIGGLRRDHHPPIRFAELEL